MADLLPCSIEQRRIVDTLTHCNVIVDAVAGSGKTTTILHIAKAYPNESILLLTYNSKLRLETREKITQLGLNNLIAHTYHSFYRYAYVPVCKNDEYLNDAIGRDVPPTRPTHWDIIILDEVQDMTPLLYSAVRKVMRDNEADDIKVRYCILGDKHQNIYKYSGADARFITLADRCFGDQTPHPWERLTLSTSYRVTLPMGRFINDVLLGEPRIKSTKKGGKPIYIKYNTFAFHMGNPLCVLLARYLKSRVFSPSEIFILAPSVRSATNKGSPLYRLENWIKREIPSCNIYIPNSDDEVISDSVLDNKLVFSTFHQAKGMERKCVFVLGFDATYFKYFNRHANPFACTNELYVATTRASERLVLCQSSDCAPLQFINEAAISTYCTIMGGSDKQRVLEESASDFTVTRLTNHLAFEGIMELKNYYESVVMLPPSDTIVCENISDQGATAESVASINGTFIPLWYSYYRGEFPFDTATMRHITTLEERLELRGRGVDTEPTGFDDDITAPPPERITFSAKDIAKKVHHPYGSENAITIPEFMYLTALYMSTKDKYVFRVTQIKSFDWMDEATVSAAIARMEELELKKPSFENTMVVPFQHKGREHAIAGITDCEDEDIIYEFKFTDDLDTVHELQLATYAWMWEEMFKSRMCVWERELENPTIIRVGDEITFTEDITATKSIKSYRGVISHIYVNGKINVKTRIGSALKTKKIELAAVTANHTYAAQPPVWKRMQARLYNIKTGEMREIHYQHDTLSIMVHRLLDMKKDAIQALTDEQFIAQVCQHALNFR